MTKSLAALCGLLTLVGSAAAESPRIKGDYIEARTADIYTGPCFSNAEVFITGHQAVMAWKINEGSFRGVDLSGLTVAAALRGTSTFSMDDVKKAQAVLIVDQRASADQRAALVALAKKLGGDRLDKVVDVRTARMILTVESHEMGADGKIVEHKVHGMPQAPKAAFWAAGLAEIVTRPLGHDDHLCGNEVVAYPPLSKGVDVLPAYTLGHAFKGQGLNTTWNDPNCRSSFVGHFAL